MKPLTDPALIREVLATADATSLYRAGLDHGIHPKTISRWRDRRTQEGPQWPTDADIAAWRADQETHGQRRARQSARARTYRKRVYLNRGPLQVDATGTTRRLQALFALGWTCEEIGKQMGVTAARVGHLMVGTFPTVYPSTHAAVARVYAALCMTVPHDPKPGRYQVRVHARNRREASRRGYAPPLAWDDIDDPTERPKYGNLSGRRKTDIDESIVERILAGERLPCTIAEKREVVRRWTGSLNELERRTGWNVARLIRTDPELEESA